MYLGAKGYFHNGLWFFLGNQGLEYLQLGRLNQIIVFVGLLLWVVILYRALKPHFIKNTDPPSPEIRYSPIFENPRKRKHSEYVHQAYSNGAY